MYFRIVNVHMSIDYNGNKNVTCRALTGCRSATQLLSFKQTINATINKLYVYNRIQISESFKAIFVDRIYLKLKIVFFVNKQFCRITDFFVTSKTRCTEQIDK